MIRQISRVLSESRNLWILASTLAQKTLVSLNFSPLIVLVMCIVKNKIDMLDDNVP